jgi:hypothetical protein
MYIYTYIYHIGEIHAFYAEGHVQADLVGVMRRRYPFL